MSRILPGDALYHLTAEGIAQEVAPLMATIDASSCCVSGQALVAYEAARAGGAHRGHVDTLRDFANICQRVMDGKR